MKLGAVLTQTDLPRNVDDTSNRTAKRESFDDYLSGFSKQEKEAAFGKPVMDAYRRGELTPAQMKRQKASMRMLESFRAMEPQLPLSNEDSEGIEQRAIESGKNAAQRILEQRRRRIAEDLAAQDSDPSGRQPVRAGAAPDTRTGAGAGNPSGT